VLDRAAKPAVQSVRTSVVTISKAAKSMGAADRNIEAFARRQHGIYDAALHEGLLAQQRIALPPGASAADYLQAHTNRAKALASRGLIEALPNGTYRIPSDLNERIAQAYAPTTGRDSGNILKVERHTAKDWGTQVTTAGITWLDREIQRRRGPASASCARRSKRGPRCCGRGESTRRNIKPSIVSTHGRPRTPDSACGRGMGNSNDSPVPAVAASRQWRIYPAVLTLCSPTAVSLS
jgi:Protein of unknown function (DUF3363)